MPAHIRAQVSVRPVGVRAVRVELQSPFEVPLGRRPRPLVAEQAERKHGGRFGEIRLESCVRFGS